MTQAAGRGAASLREAIEKATVLPEPSTITFSVSGRIELASELPWITGTLTIDGTGRSIVIDGKGAVRGFYVERGATLTVRRLTITNGLAEDGAGIRNLGSLHVEHSSIAGNRAIDGCIGFCGSGGGISNFGDATVRRSTISGNSAARDGAGSSPHKAH